MEFCNILKFLRKKNNLTQNDLADKLSITQPIVSEWENGEKYPHFEALLQLQKVFNISMDELMGVMDNAVLSHFFKIDQMSSNGTLSLTELRKENSLSVDELAKILGISRNTLKNWEKKGIPNMDKCKILIKRFDLTLEQFLDLM